MSRLVPWVLAAVLSVPTLPAVAGFPSPEDTMAGLDTVVGCVADLPIRGGEGCVAGQDVDGGRSIAALVLSRPDDAGEFYVHEVRMIQVGDLRGNADLIAARGRLLNHMVGDLVPAAEQALRQAIVEGLGTEFEADGAQFRARAVILPDGYQLAIALVETHGATGSRP